MTGEKSVQSFWMSLRKVSVFVCVAAFLIAITTKKHPYNYGVAIGWWLLLFGAACYIGGKVKQWTSHEEEKVKIWSILSLMGGAIAMLSLYKVLTLSFLAVDLRQPTSFFSVRCCFLLPK